MMWYLVKHSDNFILLSCLFMSWTAGLWYGVVMW